MFSANFTSLSAAKTPRRLIKKCPSISPLASCTRFVKERAELPALFAFEKRGQVPNAHLLPNLLYGLWLRR